MAGEPPPSPSAFRTCVKWPVTPPLDSLVSKFQSLISLYHAVVALSPQDGSVALMGSELPEAKMFSPMSSPRLASCPYTHWLA